MTRASCRWLTYWCLAVSITPPLCAEAGTVETMAVGNAFSRLAVAWAVNEVACFSRETNIANACSVTVTRSMTTASLWALFESAISVGVSCVTSTYTRWGTFTMFTTHIRASLHSTVQTTVSFSTFAYAVSTFTTSRAIIWAGFDRAICANEWILAHTFKVCTCAVTTAVFWAYHLLARNTFPSLSADAGSVVTVAMFSAGICA